MSFPKYLIPIKIHAILNFAPLIFAPLIFAHPQILRPFNFRAPLFYCKFAVFSFIRGILSSPFNFRAIALRELASSNFNGNKILFYLQILFNLLLIVNVELTKLLEEVAFKREFRREMSVNKHCFGDMMHT